MLEQRFGQLPIGLGPLFLRPAITDAPDALASAKRTVRGIGGPSTARPYRSAMSSNTSRVWVVRESYSVGNAPSRLSFGLVICWTSATVRRN